MPWCTDLALFARSTRFAVLVGAALALAGCAFAGCAFAGCGGAPAPARPPPARTPLGALETLTPRCASFVVIAHPEELLRAPATRRVVTAIFSEARLDGFSARTGVDARRLTDVVFAVCPEGRVILARGPIDAPFVVREAGARMAPVESATEEPFVRRAGFLGNGRVDLAAVAPDTLAWIDGPPQLAAVVLAAAQRPAHRRPHAFAGAHAAALLDASRGAPFALYAPRPLGLPADTGVGVLLAREEALAAWAHPAEAGSLRVSAELRGEFPDGAEANFRALAASLADSDLGAALGAREALPTLRMVVSHGRVGAVAELGADVLATGLRTVLMAEMRELIELRPSPPAERAGGQQDPPEVPRAEADEGEGEPPDGPLHPPPSGPRL